MNWYMADPHFQHARVIEFCGRPFRSVGEMNAVLIANAQSCVGPDDDLWILGDFGMASGAAGRETLAAIFDALPGRKHLVRGNHDDKAVLNLPWDSIERLVEMKDDTRHVTLCHYPMVTWYKARRGAIQLFGHVHEGWRGTRNCVNVGVDVWNFRPIRLREAMKRGNTLPVNRHWADAEHGSPAPGEPR